MAAIDRIKAQGRYGGCAQTKMVQVREASSDRNPRDGLVGGIAQTKMVQFEGVTSNQLFETLADWNRALQDNPLTELF